MKSLSIRFYLRKDKQRKNGEFPIFIELRHGRNNNTRFNTGKACHENNWDNKKRRVRSGQAGYQLINQYLEEVDYKIKAIDFSLCQENGSKPYPISLLMDRLNGKGEASKAPVRLLEGYQQFWSLKDQEIAKDESKKIYRNLRNHLKGFEEKEFKSGLLFKHLNQEMNTKFKNYLGEGGYQGKEPLAISRVAKLIQSFNAFLKYAQQKGWHDDDSFRINKVRSKHKSDFSLNYEHIQMIQAADLANLEPSAEQVRDEFVFSWFTGVRWSDINQAQDYQIRYDSDIGCYIWQYVSTKTKTNVEVGLVGPAMAILEKYGGNLNAVSNQQANRMIKEIAKKAGLTDSVRITTYYLNHSEENVFEMWEKVHFHQGRKGFVTHLLDSGLSVPEVARLSGMTIANIEKYYRPKRQDMIRKQMGAY